MQRLFDIPAGTAHQLSNPRCSADLIEVRTGDIWVRMMLSGYSQIVFFREMLISGSRSSLEQSGSLYTSLMRTCKKTAILQMAQKLTKDPFLQISIKEVMGSCLMICRDEAVFNQLPQSVVKAFLRCARLVFPKLIFEFMNQKCRTFDMKHG